MFVQSECTRRQPPGRKIYEDLNGFSVYEVDGDTSQVNYCRRRNFFNEFSFILF